MGKPTAQNNNFINHFSHPHPLQLIPPTSSPPCSACKLAGGNGRVYSCRPCNFALHESCSKMKQVIKHPSHPSHTLTLLVAPVYNGGYFNCDGCGVNGTGFSYQCSLCDFDIHALCAYKPLSIIHNSHPQHSLKLAFHSPYGANKGFSCDVCLKIGTNQWLYRCIPCEFDAHIGCISAPHPNLLQHSSSAPTPHAPHAGHPHHQDNNRPRPGNMNRLNRPANNPTRPNRPVGNLNRPIGQNGPVKGPRRQNNNSGFDGPNGPITPSEVIGQVARQSFDQGSMEGSFYDGSAMNEEFDGEVDLEIDYEANGFECNEDGEANDEEQDVDGNGLEIVAYGDDANEVAYSESEFGGSSDARSQTNDLPDQADLYPMSVRTNRGPGGGRRQNSSPNSPAPRSNNMGRNGRGGRLQGSKNPIENPRGPQNRRAQNVRNNAARAGAPVGYNRPRDLAAGPQGFNGPSGGPSNIIDNGGNNNNYNEVYGNEVSAGEYGDTYGDEGDCGFEAGDDFEDGGDFEDDGYDQTYDETYGENDFECYSDFTGGSESMYNEDESYETMDDSQYNGLNDEPNNQFSSMVGPVGGPGMSNQNQYGQNNRRGRTGRYGRGGNMNQGANSTQPRTMGRSVQQRGNRGRYRGNRQPNGQYGGPNGPNGPNVNPMMNQMVQGLCQGLAMNLLIGDGSDVNSGAGDSGISSIMGGGFLGGESEF